MERIREEAAFTFGTVRKFVVSSAGFLRKRKKLAVVSVVALVGVWLLASLLASGTLVSSKSVPSTGIVATVGLGVYSDSACTQNLGSIDWGTIVPGASAVRTVYVKNTGTAQVTLSLSMANWVPVSANGPVLVTWNLEGKALAGGQMAVGTLTLAVSSGAASISSFGMDIVISGTA